MVRELNFESLIMSMQSPRSRQQLLAGIIEPKEDKGFPTFSFTQYSLNTPQKDTQRYDSTFPRSMDLHFFFFDKIQWTYMLLGLGSNYTYTGLSSGWLYLLAMKLHIRLICHMFKLMPNWLYKSIFQTEPNMVQALVIADASMQHVKTC